MPSRRGPAPRSLTDELRSRSDDALAALLRERPDLAVPIPPDLSALGARAAGRLSVQRAMDGLDTPALQVLEVVAVLPEPVAPAQVSRLWGAPAGPVLDRLRALALVWGSPRALHLVRAARDVLGPSPAGLGPPLADALGRRSPQRIAELLEDLGLPPAGEPEAALGRLADHLGRREVVQELLGAAPSGVAAVLDRLAWGPPVGQVSDADRPVRRAGASGPVEWLLARGLLGVADAGHVVLPREVALVLRGGRVHRRTEVRPPALEAEPKPAPRVRDTAAGTAAEAVRLVAAVGEAWGEGPPPVLRAGGLGVRELRRTAARLDVDEAVAARAVEVGYIAGLVADDGEIDARWAPTPAFDAWRALGTGDRWAVLARAWLATTRSPGLVGTRDERDSPRAALGGELDRAAAPEVRRWVLEQLAAAGTDAAPQAPDPQSLLALLDWTSPRRAGRMRAQLLGWALDEAAWLGVTGAGALAPHGRLLLAQTSRRTSRQASPPTSPHTSPQAGLDAGQDAGVDGQDDGGAAGAALEAALPPPVDHVLLQADLTAVAPGPLVPDLDRELTLAADVESRGGATVFRFTPDSVRRALDAGRTGEDLLGWLARASRTPVPQPLAYLVQDTARRYGRIRIGTAQCYVRADDEAALAELLVDRRTAALRLRRLAPTVLAAQAAPETVLSVLRSMGLAPAAESSDGGVVVHGPQTHRTPPRAQPRPVAPLPPAPREAALLSAVQALRAADDAAQARAAGHADGVDVGVPPPLAATDPTAALALLRDAASARRPVWIGYTDTGGHVARRLVEPLSVEGGRITAFDRGSEEVRTFSVHRVTGVAPP
ncbi:MAG TPA: helicase-associated domain-containing protein [Kineosporiaceae bacterium]|nr:helicase-associated domain-containing protein [Kineosporiaceae bacterium]